ncbi:MAG: hypothetical protein ACTHLY_12700, partial [Pseudolabrys sp.]
MHATVPVSGRKVSRFKALAAAWLAAFRLSIRTRIAAALGQTVKPSKTAKDSSDSRGVRQRLIGAS